MNNEEVVLKLIVEALEIGANEIEVQYKDGYEEVYARSGDIGSLMKRLNSLSEEAKGLREELYNLRKRKTLKIFDNKYKIKVHIYDSFGEDAFRIRIQNIATGSMC